MRIGILGSGQLGWMLILEGRKFGYEFNVLDESRGPAARIADSFYPVSEFRKFVDKCDYVTFEFENVPVEALEYAQSQDKLRPGLDSIVIKKRRSLEKKFLKDNGFKIADYTITDNFEDAVDQAAKFGNAIIKTSESGYDGKGQLHVVDGNYSGDKLEGQEFVVEKFVKFQYESSIMISRDIEGNVASFPPSFNFNYMGKLRHSNSPLEAGQMSEIGSRLVSRLNYVGTMGIEFFFDGRDYLINEFAPRVHNGGHHTLMGFSISQFAQHVLAVSGRNVLQPRQFTPSGIVNIVGREIDDQLTTALLANEETILYNYGKTPRKGRKLGHVNITDKTIEGLRSRISKVEEIIYKGKPELYF